MGHSKVQLSWNYIALTGTELSAIHAKGIFVFIIVIISILVFYQGKTVHFL